MTTQVQTPDTATTDRGTVTERRTETDSSLRESGRVRRAARRAAARQITAYPATRSAAAVLLPGRRQVF